MKAATITSRFSALTHVLGAMEQKSLAVCYDRSQGDVSVDPVDLVATCKAQIGPRASLAKTISKQAEATGRPAFCGLEEQIAKTAYLAEREIESLVRWFCREETQ